MSKIKDWTFVFFLILIIGIVFYGGFRVGKNTIPPDTGADTVLITFRDTIDRIIIHDSIRYLKPDSIVIRDTIPANADTAAILKDYYALYNYNIPYEDSLIKANLYLKISENKFFDDKFTYEILRPQTISQEINNEYIYRKYLYFGFDVSTKDVNSTSMDLIYAFPEGYAGFGYNPMVKAFNFKAGIKIIKFR